MGFDRFHNRIRGKLFLHRVVCEIAHGPLGTQTVHHICANPQWVNPAHLEPIVALIAPAFVQAFKKFIPAEVVGLTPLAVSLLLGVVAIAATNGFTGHSWVSCSPPLSVSLKPSMCS